MKAAGRIVVDCGDGGDDEARQSNPEAPAVLVGGQVTYTPATKTQDSDTAVAGKSDRAQDELPACPSLPHVLLVRLVS